MESKNQVINLIKIVILFQLAIVAATIIGCFVAKSNKCGEADKQHIAKGEDIWPLINEYLGYARTMVIKKHKISACDA